MDVPLCSLSYLSLDIFCSNVPTRNLGCAVKPSITFFNQSFPSAVLIVYSRVRQVVKLNATRQTWQSYSTPQRMSVNNKHSRSNRYNEIAVVNGLMTVVGCRRWGNGFMHVDLLFGGVPRPF